jgi:hypothetical protein
MTQNDVESLLCTQGDTLDDMQETSQNVPMTECCHEVVIDMFQKEEFE